MRAGRVSVRGTYGWCGREKLLESHMEFTSNSFFSLAFYLLDKRGFSPSECMGQHRETHV